MVQFVIFLLYRLNSAQEEEKEGTYWIYVQDLSQVVSAALL